MRTVGYKFQAVVLLSRVEIKSKQLSEPNFCSLLNDLLQSHIIGQVCSTQAIFEHKIIANI